MSPNNQQSENISSKIVIGCNYHTKWQKHPGMRFKLVEVKGDKARLITRQSHKDFWTNISYLIFINSDHNKEKAKKIMQSKSRFSLRNQDKIEKSLGKDYLDLLLNSLKSFFRNRTDEVELIGEVKDNKPTGRTFILIPSVAKNSEIEFQFVLLSKTYDVFNLAYYHLAYYSSIG